MSLNFRKNKEDFTCNNCGQKVQGDGYTNHCMRCLWSKHVDISPGDRAAKCGGPMRPVGVETKGKESFLVHECVLCKHRKKNRVSEGDNFDEIINISSGNL